MEIPNFESTHFVETITNDTTQPALQNHSVSNSEGPDWYLREWCGHFDKRQSDLVKELGWDKSRASFVWNGRQPYRRETVNEVAAWLGIKPFELLMKPSEALALRRFKEAAEAIASNNHDTGPVAEPEKTRIAHRPVKKRA